MTSIKIHVVNQESKILRSLILTKVPKNKPSLRKQIKIKAQHLPGTLFLKQVFLQKVLHEKNLANIS